MGQLGPRWPDGWIKGILVVFHFATISVRIGVATIIYVCILNLSSQEQPYDPVPKHIKMQYENAISTLSDDTNSH